MRSDKVICLSEVWCRNQGYFWRSSSAGLFGQYLAGILLIVKENNCVYICCYCIIIYIIRHFGLSGAGRSDIVIPLDDRRSEIKNDDKRKIKKIN